MDSNVEQGVCYPQPTTLEARLGIARDFIARHEWRIPLWVDGMDNAVDWAFAGWPERLYVIGVDGRIAYKGATGPFGFEPDEVEDWLEARFPDVPAPAATASPAER